MTVNEASTHLLKQYISEIIKKCAEKDKEPGKPWCLYTKHKPHRVLGHHETKDDAEDQEAAIHAHGG